MRLYAHARDLNRLVLECIVPHKIAIMPFAQTTEGRPIYPESFNDLEWETIKNSYQIGDFWLPCCQSPAIPKTSINGVKFFAHYNDECLTRPESLWHLAAKDAVIKALLRFGANPVLEQVISDIQVPMKPDVHFLWEGRMIAIEAQHSYQTLKEYLRRQQRYESCNVEGYWLLHPERYLTLSKALGRLKMKRDFGNIQPASSFFAAISDLPVARFDPASQGGRITGAAFLNASLMSGFKQC